MSLKIISVVTSALYASVIFQLLSFITGYGESLTAFYKGVIVFLCLWLLISAIGFVRFKEWGRKQIVSANITVAVLILFFKLSALLVAYKEVGSLRDAIETSANSVEIIWYAIAAVMIFIAFCLRKNNIRKSFC